MTNEEKRYLYNLKQVLERAKNYSALSAIEELEKENTELKKDKEWLDKTDNEQTEVILNLYAQIGKMKCCANCKFFDGCAGDYLKKGFRDYIDELKQPCDEWELSE